MTSISNTFHVSFTPDRWPGLRRFEQFIGPPFDDPEVRKGTRSTANHLAKFETLAGLANRLAPTLIDDQRELDRDGYTPATRGHEFAALIETLVCELYAALDGTRRVIFGAYRGVRGVQNGKTSTLFRRATENAYGTGFPEVIRAALVDADTTWFFSLRRLRSELTHGEVGSCHLDEETGTVKYIHGALGDASRALVIEDIIDKVNEFATKVRDLIETVFGHLYSCLEQREFRVMCGIYKGRLYERIVRPDAALTFNSGQCVSKRWFETEPGLECPLRDQCGAYSPVDT